MSQLKRSTSFAIVLAVTTASFGGYRAKADNVSGPQSNSLSSGTSALGEFLKAGESTPQETNVLRDSKAMQDAQLFRNQAWRELPYKPSHGVLANIGKDVELAFLGLREGEYGAVRLAVQMPMKEVRSLVQKMFLEESDLIGKPLQLTAIQTRQIDDALRKAPGIDPLQIDYLLESFMPGVPANSQKMKQFVDYISHRHVYTLIEKLSDEVLEMNTGGSSKSGVPHLLHDKISLVGKPDFIVVTKKDLANLTPLAAIWKKQDVRDVKAMKVADYNLLLAKQAQIAKEHVSVNPKRRLVGGAAAVGALVFGGIALSQYYDSRKTQARQGWTPETSAEDSRDQMALVSANAASALSLTSIGLFLKTGDYTQQEINVINGSKVLQDARVFQNKAWRHKGYFFSSADSVFSTLEYTDEYAAVRLTVSRSERSAYNALSSALDAKSKTLAKGLAFSDDQIRALDKALGFTEYPLEAGPYRDHLLHYYTNKSTSLEKRLEYIDSRHLYLRAQELSRSSLPLPPVFREQIDQMLKEPDFIVLTKDELRKIATEHHNRQRQSGYTRGLLQEVLKGGELLRTEFMLEDDFRHLTKLKVEAERAHLAGNPKLRAAGGVAAISAIVFGGVAMSSYYEYLKAKARQGWVPKTTAQ